MKKLAIGLALTGTVMITTQAQAAVVLNGTCTGAISVASPSTVDSCIGWYSGNALNTSGNTTINSALTALGYSGPAIDYGNLPSANIIAGLNGNQTVNFGSILNGTVFVGLHFGGSAPGDAANNTSFFKLSASNLDTIHINYEQASSNAVLFASVPSYPAVPEPATWALMLLGFGGIGFVMRRKSRQTVRQMVRYDFA